MKRLEGVKRQLEEKRAKQQLQGLEGAAEWRQAALAALPPEAGPSRALPWKHAHTGKGADLPLGVVIPKKNCTWCVTQESLCLWDLDGHVWSC